MRFQYYISNKCSQIRHNSKIFANFAPKSTYSKSRVQKEKSTSFIREGNNNRCSCRRQSLGKSKRYGGIRSVRGAGRYSRFAGEAQKEQVCRSGSGELPRVFNSESRTFLPALRCVRRLQVAMLVVRRPD